MVPHLLRGDFLAVVDIGRRVADLQPGFSAGFKTYLTALGHLRRTDEAARIRERLLRLEPHFTVAEAIARSPLVHDDDRALYAAGLRLAGLPEA